MKAKILITGATGTTSQYAIQELLERNIPIRAMVRTLDERSKALEESGVEVVQGDFLDLDSIRQALNGIERAYFVYPFSEDLPKAAGYFAKAARENGVKQVVNMSQMNARENAPSPATQNHFISDEIFDWANVGAVHIKPALFAWNYLVMAAPTVVSQGKFYFPETRSKFSIVHPKDIGNVVVSLLTDPDPVRHTGIRYPISGAQTFTNEEVASTIGSLLGSNVEYNPIPVETWINVMSDQPTVNPFLAIHLRELVKDIDEGQFDDKSNTIRDLTGHEPRTFQEYLEEFKIVFTSKN